MPRFADSKEIVANEDVEPIDVIFQNYVQSLSSLEECSIDIAERQGQNL
jgi:hypothetical protein